MIIEAMLLLLTATPLANGVTDSRAGLESVNEIADGKAAIASFACHARAVRFELQWPAALENAGVDVGVGSGGEMDAAMGPSRHWETLLQQDHQVLTPPFSAADIVAAAGDENYLLLQVEAAGEQGTAQFNASDVRALFDEAVERCRLAK